MAAAEHHLLFGLLALQNGLIDQGQLVAAFQAWSRDKSRPLADHLVSRGDLDADDRVAVDALVARHLKRHGGDAEKSLAAIPAGRSTRETLGAVDDRELHATIAHVGSAATEPDAERTTTYAVGTTTSDGLRFRVLRPHARGGLGAVFVALDEELHREVALKQILDAHADDATSRQRFLNEAQITGGLEHPGIVPVYGLGTYGDGRPYYAMRFIRGDSLKEAIEQFHHARLGERKAIEPLEDTGSKAGTRATRSARSETGKLAAQSAGSEANSLELRRLLRRFLDVCNAIDYAHSRGVLHRDIKPGNIIIGKYGETLVVDWGLAKATGKSDPSAAERTLVPSSSSGSGAETLPGSAIGTPAYMSPEQAAGNLEKLGPQSDVYSLGATLYCLLTGKPPFEGPDVGALLRKVQNGEFAPPRQLDASIDKALEAVCLKAMSLSPADRYPTTKALADDVERWMADEPVAAYAEPWTRTLTRWLTRHRTGVTAAAAAGVAALVGLATVATTQAQGRAALEVKNHELSEANIQVRARYDLAVEAIKTFHTGVSEDFLLKEDQFKDLRDRLLKSASDFYGKLGALLGKETDVESRRALTLANFEMAELTGKVGRIEDALVAHRAVLARREALADDPAADTEVKADVGRSLTAVASLLESTGKVGEAEATYRNAEALLESPVRASPLAPAARAALADCRSRLGSLLSATGKADDSLAAYRLARADQEVLAGASGAPNEAWRDLADTIQRIGFLLRKQLRWSEAEAEYRAALVIRQRLAHANPASAEFRSRMAASHRSLGSLLGDLHRWPEAEAELRAALAIQRRLADEHSAVTDFRHELASIHINLALLLHFYKPSEAEAELRAALAVERRLADEHPAVTGFRYRLAAIHSDLGDTLWGGGRFSEAEAEYRAALAIQRRLANANPTVTGSRQDLAITQSRVGDLLAELGRWSEAEAETRAALAIWRKLADEHPAVTEFRDALSQYRSNFGDLLMRMGRPSEAEAELRAALAIRQGLADEHPASADLRAGPGFSHRDLGLLLAEMGRSSEAEAELRAALAIRQGLADANPTVSVFRTDLAVSHRDLGDLLMRTGRLSEAEAEYRAALAIWQKAAGADPANTDGRRELALSHSAFGDLLMQAGRSSEAEAEYRAGLAIRQTAAVENPASIPCQHELASSLARMGKIEQRRGRISEAVASFRRAVAVMDGLPWVPSVYLYDLACFQALLAGATESRTEADRAMDTLRRAVALRAGVLARMRTDTDLDPLRDREDFRALMMDLAMPAEPFAPGGRSIQPEPDAMKRCPESRCV
jgi:serine/threonine-protein kinase